MIEMSGMWTFLNYLVNSLFHLTARRIYLKLLNLFLYLEFFHIVHYSFTNVQYRISLRSRFYITELFPSSLVTFGFFCFLTFKQECFVCYRKKLQKIMWMFIILSKNFAKESKNHNFIEFYEQTFEYFSPELISFWSDGFAFQFKEFSVHPLFLSFLPFQYEIEQFGVRFHISLYLLDQWVSGLLPFE